LILHTSLFVRARERPRDEISMDCSYMNMRRSARRSIRGRVFIRKWRLKHRAIANGLEEAGDRLSSLPLDAAPVPERPHHMRSNDCTGSPEIVPRRIPTALLTRRAASQRNFMQM
jgi:hypothetical protein